MLTLINLDSTTIFATGRTVAELKAALEPISAQPLYWSDADAYDDAQQSADGRYAVVRGISDDETSGEAALENGEIISYLMSYEI